MNDKKSFIRIVMAMTAFFLFGNTVYAKPTIEWKPKRLSVTQPQGTVDTYNVSIKVTKEAKNVSIRVVPPLTDWIHVYPEEIGDIHQGQEIELTVIVGLPLDARVGKKAGVIQIKETVRNKASKNVAKPLPVAVTVKKWVDDGLPPDPGEAGKQTLLGIDSDQDGVRDDVQRFIALHYYKSDDEKARLALEQFAESIQYGFTVYQATPEGDLDDVYSKIIAATDCITGTSATLKEDIVFVENIMQNTDERVQAYIAINESAAGRIFVGTTDFVGGCSR